MGERGKGSQNIHSLRNNSGERISPPKEITNLALEVWNSIVNTLPSNHFVDSDISMLHTYCEAYVNVLTAQERLKTVEWVYVDVKGVEQKSRWLDILKSQQSAMALLATKLMICPSSRIDETHKNPITKPISKRGDLLG